MNLRLFKKYFLVSCLLSLVSCLTTGCSSEYNLATNQEESLMYGADREEQMGAGVAMSLEKEFKVVTDLDLNNRVQGILNRITAVSDRQDLVYSIKVLDKDMVNAVSLPGGYIYIFKGLLDKVENDDQLASVIGHEVGHVTARHVVKRIQAAYSALALQILSTQAGGQVAGGVSLALSSLFSEYSQEDEFEADYLGFKYMKAAGYKPEEMVKFFEILMKEDKKKINQFYYFRTHPYVGQRISKINGELAGQLNFKDYVNLTGMESTK